MARVKIPPPVINVAAMALADIHSHGALQNAFLAAGAPGPIPDGSKVVKARAWLQQVNNDSDGQPLAVLGELLSEVYEVDVSANLSSGVRAQVERRRGLDDVLGRVGLRYESPGRVIYAAHSPAARGLHELIANRDWTAVHDEFKRALSSLESAPADAVSAACNILESLLKTYLEDEGHDLPKNKDIVGLWDAAKTRLGLDPALMPEEDMRKILGGLHTVAAGIGALRTHASTAHGQGRKVYRLEPRHARLAVNAAHTLATFVIETWDTRRAAPRSMLTQSE